MCAGIATAANWRCSGVSEGGRVTFIRLRDADAERPMDPGARLLGADVATPRNSSQYAVSGADQRRPAYFGTVSAIERDLAEISPAWRMGNDGTSNG